MNSVIAAVRSRFEGDATLAAYGKLWFGDAPSEEAGTALSPPYARQIIVASELMDAFTQAVTLTVVQIDLFHTNIETLSSGYNALLSRFDRCTLTMSPSTNKFLGCQRSSESFEAESEFRSKEGLPVYKCWARYDIYHDRPY